MRTYVADISRSLAAAGVLLAAVVHFDLYEAGFSQVRVIGPLFLLNFIGGLVIGTGILVWRHWLPVFLGAGFGATTVVFYWISVVHGLFGIHELTTGWSEITAETAEYVAVLSGLVAAAMLWLERHPRTASARSSSSSAAVRRPDRNHAVPAAYHRPR